MHAIKAGSTANPERISTDGLLSSISNPKTKIIDVRSADAYNGWREGGEARGGHIKGAKSLPAKWADYIDWIEAVRSKGILPGHSLILYGSDPAETRKIAGLFLKAGYPGVKLYDDFMREYSQDAKNPMDSLPGYTRLVSARWLDELMSNGSAPEYPGGRHVVCHVHYQNPGDYRQGHIPGAVPLDTNTLESGDTWNRRSPDELKKTLEETGIDQNTTVILYGRFSYPSYSSPYPGSSAGQLGAMRCAFIMMYAGVKDVRILNGGVQSWLDAGLELSKEDAEKKPAGDFGAEIPAHPEYAVDLEEARQILKDPGRNLVCVRSRREYTGEISGYHYIKKKGRIPGAVLADCGSDPYHLENYRNLDHTFREYHEIEEIWKEAGVTPDKPNAFYCGTGWRGSEAFFNARLMGWQDVSVFDGGWFEWSNNNLPFETGLPGEGGGK